MEGCNPMVTCHNCSGQFERHWMAGTAYCALCRCRLGMTPIGFPADRRASKLQTEVWIIAADVKRHEMQEASCRVRVNDQWIPMWTITGTKTGQPLARFYCDRQP